MAALFKYVFVNEHAWILITISLKFVPKGPINNIPLSGPMMALFTGVYMRHSASMSWTNVMHGSGIDSCQYVRDNI